MAFNAGKGFSVSSASAVTSNSAPILAPSGSGSVAAITLTKGAILNVDSGCSLSLTGTVGGAIFLTADGTSGEHLANGGTVTYMGLGSAKATDYLKVPVENSGVFAVKGGGKTASGSTLQVLGNDTSTNNASFYQDGQSAQTSISGGGTLWCYNNYTMSAGMLQTTDGNIDILKVGTTDATPVDGSVTLTGGNVAIYTTENSYGRLQIMGTTTANAPTLNVGTITLNFKVNMSAGSNLCDQLIVGTALPTSGTGRVNFGSNGGTTTVQINPQGNTTNGHNWPIIYFGSETGDVTLSPTTGFTKNWSNPNYLEIDN